MTGWICGCIVGIVVACIVVPPAGWAIAAVVGTVVAFAGDSSDR
jgi:hypothetical protein